jgi:hypothetical protein
MSREKLLDPLVKVVEILDMVLFEDVRNCRKMYLEHVVKYLPIKSDAG